MNKIGIIGRVAKGKKLYDGQTVLTRTFSKEIEKNVKNCKMYYVDTYNYKHNAIKCLFKTIMVLFTCKNIFILLSKNGLMFYLPFLYYSNKIFHKNIYHRVIGGSLANMTKEHKHWVKYLNSFKCNYVETNSIKEKLNGLNIFNVKVSPNFKQITPISDKELSKIINSSSENKKFCTFSRVIKEKGITDAINAINEINKYATFKTYLDIYGPVDLNYEKEFKSLIKNNIYIKYKGVINYCESVNVLKNYYMLLFPTYWKSEGFPGTFIDCFAAGLPIIATNWNCNSEILNNGVTGIIYNRDENNINLIESIRACLNDESMVKSMSKKCLEEYQKYQPDKVIRDIVDDLRF